MDSKNYFLPAEWHPQSFIQLTWPHQDTDWSYMLDEVEECFLNLAREIASRQPLLLVAPEFPKALENFEFKENVFYVECPTNDTWARDHGFISLLNEQEEVRLVDFCFNGWGMKFAACKDNLINSQLVKGSLLNGTYQNCRNFVLEGGSIESDGEGTLLTTSLCLLAPNRNQPMTQQEIDSYLRKTLCADRIIWINNGNLTGDDTDGHIDTLVRIAPNDTLLYVGCDDPTDEQYGELHAMEQQLRSLATTDGHPYRLLKLPMPRPIYHDGERLPATYANFLAINGAILYPTYAQDDLDAEAASIMREAFPGLEVVGIDCRSVIMQHGSLHCCTMQYPSAGHGDDAAGTL